MRADQLRAFVLISTGATVVWKSGKRTLIWHASVDGLHGVCSPHVLVTDADPYPSTYDRSNDLMTCIRCQELVRRLPPVVKADTVIDVRLNPEDHAAVTTPAIGHDGKLPVLLY